MARQRKRQQLSFELPLLPRRRGILFPNTANPILVGRRTSVAAIEEAALRDSVVVVAIQRDPNISEIELGDLYPMGTEAVVSRALKLPDGTTQVWVQGQRRLHIEELVGSEPYYSARVTPNRRAGAGVDGDAGPDAGRPHSFREVRAPIRKHP